jgi:RNA-binding protein
MTSKQRAYLKSKAQTMEPILHVGKGSISPQVVQSVSDALEARELIKISILKNCMDDPGQVAQTLAERSRAQVVQVIGRKAVLFRQNPKETAYPLDKI